VQTMRIEPRHDGRGIPYYWIAFQRDVREPASGTDLYALSKHRISVTPLKLDLTDEPSLTRYARIFDQGPHSGA
jgi:5'-nucleotidase